MAFVAALAFVGAVTLVSVTTPSINPNYTPFITLDSWSKEDEEKFKNYYVRLQLPEDKAKQLAPESNIRLEAKVKVDNKVRMDIDSNTSPVKVTEAYMGKYYPSLSKVAENVIMSALGGDAND